MSDSELEPIEPETAVEMYLDDRRTELSQASLKAHEYRLSHLLRWCRCEDLDNLNVLSGRDLHRYKTWRREDGDLKTVSLKTQIDTIRVFIRWCESIDAVRQDLSDKILTPTLEDVENHRDVMLAAERAEAVLEHLGRFEYASFCHVLLVLLWRTGMRTGTAHALDIEDYDRENQRLQARHRPETGTPLKNKENGERLIAIGDETCRILDDYLAHQRPEVTDENGRQPLLATTHGRPHKSVVRDRTYQWTRPCVLGECPHGRTERDCEATDDQAKRYSKCPSSRSPHALRRGSITHHLSEDVPEKVVSDRMNVGQDVLDKHYDRRSEETKVEQRRGYLEGL